MGHVTVKITILPTELISYNQTYPLMTLNPRIRLDEMVFALDKQHAYCVIIYTLVVLDDRLMVQFFKKGSNSGFDQP